MPIASAMGYDEPVVFGYYCTIFRHDIPNPLVVLECHSSIAASNIHLVSPERAVLPLGYLQIR